MLRESRPVICLFSEKKRNKQIPASAAILYEDFFIINSMYRQEDSARICFLQNKQIMYPLNHSGGRLGWGGLPTRPKRNQGNAVLATSASKFSIFKVQNNKRQGSTAKSPAALIIKQMFCFGNRTIHLPGAFMARIVKFNSR